MHAPFRSATQLQLPLGQLTTVVDLFCGCGGMSLGFQNAGFKIIAAFDSWQPAVAVYQDNFDHEVLKCDLGNRKADEVVTRFNPDVIIGGPPCQDFSSAGPNNLSSERAGLLGRFVDLIRAATPAYFVMENVPRIRLTRVFRNAEKDFRALGYGLTAKVLNAAYCGVPQNRERLFLVGALGADDGFLDRYLGTNLAAKPLTLRQYFGASLGVDFYFRVPTNYSRRGVFSIDEPCATIRAIDRPIPKGYPRHPDDPVPIGPKVRGFTVLERSYIQTFPKSFRFSGTKGHLNTMIGNAVPVKLAQFVAVALARYMGDTREP